MLRRLKENKKKGFTLVELIVVLVILAILAALLVPALTGYIDRAKKKSIIAETRQCVMAAQTLVDEKYGTLAVGEAITVKESGGTIDFADVVDLAELKGKITITNVTLAGADTKNPNKITELTCHDGTYTCTYNPGETTNTDGDYKVGKYTP